MREDTLSNSELDRIYKHLISPSHKRFFSILRYTGAKIYRVCELKIGDVYDDCLNPLDCISFGSASDQILKVPIVPRLNLTLLRYRPKIIDSKAWLFPSIRKGEHIKMSSADKFFRAALYKAELDSKGISLNMIRRSFIYELYSHGVSFSIIQELTGLKTVQTYKRDFVKDPINLQDALTKIFEY